jgi:hypothetical protein
MDTNWHQKEPSRALKLQIYGAEIWNCARNENWHKKFDSISMIYYLSMSVLFAQESGTLESNV